MMKPSLMIASLCQHLSKGARARQDIGAHISNWTLLIFIFFTTTGGEVIERDGDDFRLEAEECKPVH